MKKTFVLLCSLLLAAAASAQEFWLESDALTVKQGQTGLLLVNFADETEDYAGFQFDITLPEGITVEKAEFYAQRDYLDEGGTAHTVTYNQSGTLCRLMCSAPNNIYQDLEGGSDLLITLTLKAALSVEPGTYDALISGIKFAKLYDPALGDRFITFADIPFTLTVAESQLVVLDELATAAPAAQQGVNVELRRTMYADKWNTFVLPFPLTSAQVKSLFGDDTRVAAFQSVSEETDGTLTLHFTSYSRQLAANTPYLVKPQNGGSSFVIEGVTIAPAEAVVTKGTVSFIGTYVAAQPIPSGDYYLSDETFYRSAGMSLTKAFRGYFHDSSQQAARQLRLDLDGAATGISTIAADAEGTTRSFTADGRPASPSHRQGVVIVRDNSGTYKKMIR